MKRTFDIVIVGAGMVGLTLAALLHRAGTGSRLRVTVVDAAAAPAFEADSEVALRVSALSTGSAQTLASVGAWQIIESTRACPYRDMCVWDASASVEGPDTLHFSAAEHALPQLGFIVENVLVQSALLQSLEASDVSLEFDCRIEALRKRGDRFDVVLDDERILATDLLVGADGARSYVRGEAALPVRNWSYRQNAFVTHLRPQQAHGHVAWQRFLRTGPLGILPLQDGRVSVVWSTSPEQAERALDCSGDELQTLLTEASDGVLGALTPAGPRGAFPLHAQYAAGYVVPGLALVGDAAHSIHPLAGQGANLGLADAAALAAVVDAALERNEYPGDMPVLRRYERARKGDNQVMLRFVDALNRLFAIDAAPVADLRGAGMRLFNRSGPIKRHAVEVALGIGP